MKLISWNVNGLRACMTKGFMDAFESLNADIFCLQETKLSGGAAGAGASRLPPVLELCGEKRLFRHGYFYEGRTFKRCLWDWNPGARP